MAYTTRAKARPKVQAREAFRTSNGNLYGEWTTPNIYVVYSYSSRWPLFMWDGFKWFENEDRHSRTTSQHRGYAHPHTATQLRSRTWMRQFIAAEETRHRATRQPLWYVRWKDFDRRKRIDLVEPAYSDDAPEGGSGGYMYVRAADEVGAYAAALATTKKRRKAA